MDLNHKLSIFTLHGLNCANSWHKINMMQKHFFSFTVVDFLSVSRAFKTRNIKTIEQKHTELFGTRLTNLCYQI